MSRPRYLDSGTIEVGSQVERRRRDGKVRASRVVDDGAIGRMASDVELLFLAARPRLVGIERIQDVHPTGRHEARTGQATGTAIATGLVLANGIAWALYMIARHDVCPVATVQEAEWRKALGCEPPRGTSTDAWIGRIIPARIDGWPKPMTPGITNHVRDAAGVAEFAATAARLR